VKAIAQPKSNSAIDTAKGKVSASQKPQFQVSLTPAMYYLTPAYRALVPSWP
jgi:hypothetical protein